MSGRGTPELSIVIPCFNEAENVVAICRAVGAEAARHAHSYEIILIDNGSTDGTRDIIRDLCAAEPRVRAIFNTRNYGQMRSPTYGIYQASGAAVIGMCADFQDPPEMIGEFLRLWRAGAQIVLGQRRSEEGAGLLGPVRQLGYAVLGRISDYPLIPGVTGFGLFDRVVVDTLATWNEPEPFFRGMVVESGYRLALVPVDRPARAAGTSKNDVAALASFALSGLAGSAKTLLRAPILIALGTGALAILLTLGSITAAFIGGPVWSVLAAALALAMFAVLMLFVGLIGEQVRVIAERTRGAPLVLESERINFPATRATAPTVHAS